MGIYSVGQIIVSSGRYYVAYHPIGMFKKVIELEDVDGSVTYNSEKLELIKEFKTKWLQFHYYKTETRKTPIVSVLNMDGHLLGVIAWVSRSFWYSSMPNTRYDKTCLADIGKVIAELTTKEPDSVRLSSITENYLSKLKGFPRGTIVEVPQHVYDNPELQPIDAHLAQVNFENFCAMREYKLEIVEDKK